MNIENQYIFFGVDGFPDLTVKNNGSGIMNTNFWETWLNTAGKMFLLHNDTCFRLLVPDSLIPAIPEIQTGREVIITCGVAEHFRGLPAPAKGVELLFEDDSEAPFNIFLDSDSVDNFSLVGDEIAGKDWSFAAYSRDGLVYESVARYRTGKIPCLKAWK